MWDQGEREVQNRTLLYGQWKSERGREKKKKKSILRGLSVGGQENNIITRPGVEYDGTKKKGGKDKFTSWKAKKNLKAT